MGMMFFQVEEDKVEKVSECLEKGLKYIGKAMQCVEDMRESGAMGQRGGMGERDDYGMSGERRWGNQYGGGRMGSRGGGHYGSRNYSDPYYE